MFRGDETRFAATDLERWADEGVRVFLAAYAADEFGDARPSERP